MAMLFQGSLPARSINCTRSSEDTLGRSRVSSDVKPSFEPCRWELEKLEIHHARKFIGRCLFAKAVFLAIVWRARKVRRHFKARRGRPRTSVCLNAWSLREMASRCENSFVRDLPADMTEKNFVRQVFGAAYTRVMPTPVRKPVLLAHSSEALALLGMNETESQTDEFVDVFAGNAVLPGFDPFAAVYAGHQFGTFAGQLGDGRAISLGEVLKEDGQRWELQLKGAGRTPYSRGADGRAVLRSSVREFLASEAMYALGVPTTRALSIVATGEDVLREALEPGAIVCRMAPSFIRFGHFEHFSERQEYDLLRALAEHTMRRHFQDVWDDAALSFPEKVAAMLGQVCEDTAFLIAEWQRVGFVHGVLNTDNMSICGLTLDYGPFGMMDAFDPQWTPNSTDGSRRRYCLERQPGIGLWNLNKLASSLLPLVRGHDDLLQEALERYVPAFREACADVRCRKLGVREYGEEVGDIWREIESCLQDSDVDYTLFFRNLIDLPLEAEASDEALYATVQSATYEPPSLPMQQAWIDCLRHYASLCRAEGSWSERRALMVKANPKIVPRSWMLQQAAELAQAGEPSAIQELLEALRRPYDDGYAASEQWSTLPPKSAKGSMLS